MKPSWQLESTTKIGRVEHDYRELKTALGLGHFEGRTYQGFLRHRTLASVAQAFCTLERLCPPAPATV